MTVISGVVATEYRHPPTGAKTELTGADFSRFASVGTGFAPVGKGEKPHNKRICRD